jgi:hypothetical protein
MGITFIHNQVNRYLKEVITIVHDEIFNALSLLGEKCIIKIRNRSGVESWNDQTGNLRSSIQYAIYEEGKKKIESNFQKVLNGSDGLREASNMIADLARLYSSTFALVVVAGMNYADKVEALDNKDVLASTELWAKKEIDKHLEMAKQRALTKLKTITL